MPASRFKTKRKKSTKLYEACQRCGRPKEGNLGSTITRWVFRLATCNCTPDQPTSPHPLLTTESPKQGTQENDAPQRNNQAKEMGIDLGDRYQILETIGQGGMGTVYRVRDKLLEKDFAIKVLRDDFATDPSAIKRFEQEADAASELTHANMLSTYGRGSTAAGAHYIIMDFLEGESLSQVLSRETKLDAARVIDISAQICDALAHAHMKGLIHRDLKPSNIMLVNKNESSDVVKVLDFGIAKLKATSNRETQNLTETGDLFGSPSYMSPEQCLGFAVDARSDIYSLGCMMYEMLSGQPPFGGKNPIQTVIQHLNDEPLPFTKSIPSNQTNSRLQAIIMRCLEKNSAQRYQSMDQLKADLDLVAAGKLPKQAKKRRLKQVPLSWPVVSTIILVGAGWVTIELSAFSGFNNPGKEISIVVAVLGYLLSYVCASLWSIVLTQACWKRITKVRSGEAELHETWLTAALALLTTCVIPALTWFYIATSIGAIYSFIQPKGPLSDLASVFKTPVEGLTIIVLIISNVSVFLAFLAGLGWAFVRGARALKMSRAKQRLVAWVYVGCLALCSILGYRNLAWIAYSSNYYFNSNSAHGYQPNAGLEMALAINPDFAKAYYERGIKKAAAGEPTAINDFSKVIALKPDKELECQAYKERSKLYAASSNFASAISDLEQAKALASYSKERFNLPLASYLRRTKQYDKALEYYNKLLAEQTGNALAYQQRSELYLQQGNLMQALADIDSALVWEQNNLAYFTQRANIYEKLGKADLAAQDYNTVMKRFSMGSLQRNNDSKVYRAVAAAEQKLGFSDEANKHLALAADLERKSGHPDIDQEMSQYYY